MDQPLFVEYVDHERARRFCRRCQDDGFTPGQTALLAAVNSWGLRGFVSNACANNRSLNIAKHWGQRVTATVEKIRSPEDLLNFVADPIAAICANWSFTSSLPMEQQRLLFQGMGKGWVEFADQLSAPVQEMSWDQALENVTASLTHLRIDPNILPAPIAIADACRVSGLNSVSWSTWFYDTDDVMAQHLIFMDQQVSRLSGLPQGCLGVFGRVNLEIDTVPNNSESGSFFMWRIGESDAPPTSTGVRLHKTSSWHSLCHEWTHAVDFILGGSQGKLKMLSQTDPEIQALLWEHTSRLDASGQEYLEGIKLLQWSAEQQQEPLVQQMRRMPKTVTNFFGDFIAQEEQEYFQTFPERLAYMSEQASLLLGFFESNVLTQGSPQNRTDAADLLAQFFQLPQVAEPLAQAHRSYTKDVLKKGISHRRNKTRAERGLRAPIVQSLV